MAALGVALALAMGLLASTLASTAHAAGKGAVLILDANTGRVLHESAPDEPRYPASLAKMMTLYLVFEAIEHGRLDYQTKIRFSANAAAQAPSKLDLDEGEEIALIDAIKVLITKSANDVAVALAEHIAGSEERFAQLMTQRARQLGMSGTTFRNASGLPDEAQITTARDMATLALRLFDDFPRHYPLFATRMHTHKDETFRNHNTLLFNYEGTEGFKTGYIRASGFNLVTSVRRGRKHLIGVVFGGASAASRNTAMRTYLNMGLVKASNERTRKPAAPLIARAMPAPERGIAVPTPQRVARPPAVAAAAVPPSPEPATAPQPAPRPIEIARVRPVLVGRSEPGSDTSDSAEPSPRRSAATIEEVLARTELPPEPRQYLAANPGSQLPSWAAPPANSPLHLSAAAPVDKPALLSNPLPARGALPSTFEQQAANLARGERPVMAPAERDEPAAPAPLRATLPPPTGSLGARSQASVGTVAGSFQIQIGAFQSAAEAERQLAAIRERAPTLLAKAAAVTQPVQQGAKLLYRARYTGLGAQAATSACSELKRLKVDCLVMKAE